jgi:hypothetical protein
MRRTRALSSREYELIRARQRLLPLRPDLAKQADRLIAKSADAADFARNLDASLRSTDESRLVAAIFGGVSTKQPKRTTSRRARRAAAIRVRFATGQYSVANHSKDRKRSAALWSELEFEVLPLALRADSRLRKLLGRRPDIFPLLYSGELGSRRDAIAGTDLLVVNAEALLAHGNSPAARRELSVKAVNLLYEVAWALHFGLPVIWYLPSRFKKRAALERARLEMARTLRNLARWNYAPIFKMKKLTAGQQRFMPEDYQRLFAEVQGQCVAGAPDLREQLYEALADLSGFRSRQAAPAVAEMRSIARRHVG